VSEAVRSVDARLLDVIWRRHRLRAHFAAIRRFLLLGQGDWVTAFMDLVRGEGGEREDAGAGDGAAGRGGDNGRVLGSEATQQGGAEAPALGGAGRAGRRCL
jgi:gamma-tubulin complex component 3